MSSEYSSSSSSLSSATAVPSFHCADPDKPEPFEGHGSEICSVCYSPDGRRIATGGVDPPIRIWDSYTGEMLLELQGHSGSVTSVCYSSDGQRFVSGWSDGSICVWNASDGELVWEHAKAHGWNTTIACSVDNRHIASCGGDGTVKVWRVEDMAQIFKASGHPGVVLPVCFSPDGHQLAAGCGHDKIRVFDVATGSSVVELQGEQGIRTVVYSPDGSQLASSSHRVIRVWNASRGDVLFDLTCHSLGVRCLAFSPDGKQILSGSGDRTICLWDSGDRKRIGQPVRRHAASITAASFAPNGTHFVTGAEDGSMRVWDAYTREVVLPEMTQDEREQYEGPFQGHIGGICDVTYFPDGSKVASASKDMTIRNWDVKTGKQVMQTLHGGCFSISVSSDGSRLVGGGNRGAIIWDTHSGDVILGPLGDMVFHAVFSPDDRLVAGACDGEVILWDSRTGQQLRSTEAQGGLVLALSFARDGSRLASGSNDGAVYVWDVSTAELVAGPFKGHTNVVNSVAFSPDSLRIVSGSDDGTLRIWNTMTGATILGPLETSSRVWSVLYSPDGTRICSTSRGGMCLWDGHTGDLIHGPLEYSGGITCAVYSPSGKHIVTGSKDGSLRLCDAATGEIIHVPDPESDLDDPSDSLLDLPATRILEQPQHGQAIQAPRLDWPFGLPSTTPAENNVAAHATSTTSFSFSRLRNTILNVLQNNSPPDPNAHDQHTRTFPRPLSRSHLSFSFRSFRNPFVNTSGRRNPPTDDDGREDSWVAEARTRPIYAFQTGPLPDEIERGCFFHLASYICYGQRDPNVIASSHNLTYVRSPPGSQATASHGNVPYTYPPPPTTTTTPTATPSGTSPLGAHIWALPRQFLTFLRSPRRSDVSNSPSTPAATNAGPVIPTVVVTSPSSGSANGPSDVDVGRQVFKASPLSTNASVPTSDCLSSTSSIISPSLVRVVEPRSTSPETLRDNLAMLQSAPCQPSSPPVTVDVSTPPTGVLTEASSASSPLDDLTLVSASSPIIDTPRASVDISTPSGQLSSDEIAVLQEYRRFKENLCTCAGGPSPPLPLPT